MIFATGAVQHLFHKLPTAEQVKYSRLEHDLACKGMTLSVLAVLQTDEELEVMIRICHKLDSDSAPANCRSL